MRGSSKTKGPASAPTLPDQDPHNPGQEKSKDMDTTTTEPTVPASKPDWCKIANNYEDAIRHLGMLADIAFAKLVDEMKREEGTGPNRAWSIPSWCGDEVVALMFAIRETAGRAPESAR